MRRKIWSGHDVAFDSVGGGVDLKFGGEGANRQGGEANAHASGGGEGLGAMTAGGESTASEISGGEGTDFYVAYGGESSGGIYAGFGGEALQLRPTA